MREAQRAYLQLAQRRGLLLWELVDDLGGVRGLGGLVVLRLGRAGGLRRHVLLRPALALLDCRQVGRCVLVRRWQWVRLEG